jgi:hypothetical protein
MARKKVNLKAAKAARQKKLAIGGAVLLVALLVFQVPRTLKMLQGPTPKHQSAAATTTATTTTAASSAAAPSAPVTATPTSAPILTAQLAPPAREGQLEVLSATFKSKDPFRQLIDENEAPSEASDTTTKKPDANLKVVAATKTKPASTPKPVAPTAFTAPTAPKVKKITLPMLSATISVNGVREGVDLKDDFPTDSPLFHLVSLTKRTAKISVAGGSLASGAPTLTLRRGKPLTLVNTADGTRYRLVLVALSTAAAVQPAQTSSDSSNTGTTTTPSTTTPTTTTPTIGG